jgi:hypothetical protein
MLGVPVDVIQKCYVPESTSGHPPRNSQSLPGLEMQLQQLHQLLQLLQQDLLLLRSCSKVRGQAYIHVCVID